MPQYLLQLSYASESLAAQMKEPQDRIEVVGKQLAESAGVRFVGGGYSFGDYDVTIIAEAADETAIAAVSIVFSAGGAIKACKTTPLLDGAQWVAALKKASSIAYHPAK